MATDKTCKRSSLRNDCLLNQYAQRQLKALELDLKCAQAKSFHQTKRSRTFQQPNPPSQTFTFDSARSSEDEFGDFQASAVFSLDSQQDNLLCASSTKSTREEESSVMANESLDSFGKYQSCTNDNELDLWTRLMTAVRRILTRCCDLLLTSNASSFDHSIEALNTSKGVSFCLGK